MIRNLLLALTLFAFCGANGQVPPKSGIPVSELQIQLNKSGVDQYFYQGKTFTGETREVYESVQKIESHIIKNGFLQRYLGWDENEVIVRDYEYQNGVPVRLRMFYGNKQCYFDNYYVNGIQHGKQYGYYRDGSLRLLTAYQNGTKLYQKKYDKNGTETIVENWR